MFSIVSDLTPLAAVELGNFINGFKLLPIAVIGLVWVWLITWADKDTLVARMPRETINAINLGGFVVATVVMLLLPNFWAAIGIFIFFFAAEVGTYLVWRNNTVGLSDLKDQFTQGISNIGKRTPKEMKATEGSVVLFDKSGKALPAPLDEDPARAGYDALQSVFTGPMRAGAQKIELRPVEGGATLRHTVDGVTLESKAFTKENASAAIELVKQLAGLDPADRRKPQLGKMKISTETGKFDLDVYTAGSTVGELLRISINFKKQFDFTIEREGFLPDQLETILNSIADRSGVVLLAVPEGQGQTNLAYAILKKHDAFLSHIQTLERDPPIDLEGIKQNKLPASAPPADEGKQISWMISQEPDVILLDRCDDARSAVDLARYASEHRVYLLMRAPTTFDALAQWRKLVGDDALAIKSLKLVVAERLVRVLCEACKIGYTPDAEALKKMNMSPDRVTKLYQARKEPMRDQKGNEVICPFCNGIAYKGRTGVFEFFKIDEEVRQAVLSNGTVNQFKALFRKQRQRYLQESALSRVELGDTSVEEVLRVLRGQASTSGSKSRPPVTA